MALKDMKIGTRLGMGFGVITALLVVIATIGVSKIYDLHNSIFQVTELCVPLLITAAHEAENINIMAIRLRNTVLFDDPQALAAEYKGWDAAKLKTDEALAHEGEIIRVPKMRELHNQLAEAFEKSYVPISQKMLEYAKAGKKEEFVKTLRTELYPVFKDIKGNLAAMKELQEKLVAENAIEAEATFESSRNQIIGLSVIAVILASLVGFLVVRSLTGPIAQIQSTIAAVEATGDYSRKVDYQSADEVGQTALAFNLMMDSLQSALSNTNAVMGAVAAGDFSKRIDVETRGDLAQLKQSVNGSVDKLQLTMNALADVMKAMREGDFNKRVDAKVEGEFKLAVDQAMQAMLGDVGNVMGGVAHGNLTGRVRAEGRGDLAKLKEAINTSLDGLSRSLKTINDNTRHVAAAANQSSTAIGQISDGAQNQMHAIGQVATAVRQTASSVEDVTKNTEAASQKSQESVKLVRDGKIKMERMVEVVNSIAANSEKINKITEVIEGIANKTNLLSLNAAIEAARAGEHGKGFAVVAEEVGKLAANSASSTQEIASLVHQAVADANRAVASVREVADDMGQIERGSVEAEGMMQRISAALEQQSAAVHEINANVASLNQIGQSNAAASEEITATVVELAKIADNTRREVEKFTV